MCTLVAENQNVEWKESWRDEYLKWICGCANAQGGKIYSGTNDDGTVSGAPGRLWKDPHRGRKNRVGY